MKNLKLNFLLCGVGFLVFQVNAQGLSSINEKNYSGLMVGLGTHSSEFFVHNFREMGNFTRQLKGVDAGVYYRPVPFWGLRAGYKFLELFDKKTEENSAVIDDSFVGFSIIPVNDQSQFSILPV